MSVAKCGGQAPAPRSGPGSIDVTDHEYAAFVTRFPPVFGLIGVKPIEHGLDYYGFHLLEDALRKLRAKRPAMVSRLFVEALLDAGAHHHAPSLLPMLEGPVMILNGYNIINTPAANFTHRTPQSFLGLCATWGEAELATLAATLRRGFARLASRSSADAARALALALSRDADLDRPGLKFPIEEHVIRCYLDELSAIASDAGARSGR
jgi:hypothetical protein